jgi:anthranilate synthase/aminodeoxychorismate synthase-like glutamine amidotransferase
MGWMTSGGTAARVLIIDNYDSFTYNTVQLLGALGADCTVVHNDQVAATELALLAPDGILLSAGPGTPLDAGVTLDVIALYAGRIPLLGVCLGHQAIAHAFGGRVVSGGRLMHGKTCEVRHDGAGLFSGVPRPAIMARYNSLLVEEVSLPPCLRVTARSEHGEIMALSHERLALDGVQFHPESVLSRGGDRLFSNWLARLRAARRRAEMD